MRIRSIKPEFWRSDDISALEWDERLLFVGLWSYVDDNGVGVDKLSSIAADLFASDLERNPPETFARVSRGLQQLAAAGRIVRYAVESRPYLEVVNWDKHQRIDRPNKPRFPRSDADAAEIRDTLARVAAKEASGTEEQGNRGTEEQVDMSTDGGQVDTVRSPYSDSFLEWWQVYPRKESKGDAWKAWEQLRKSKQLPPVDDLKAAATSYAARGNEPQFLKLPGGWLRDRKWEDEAVRQANKPASEFDWMNS